ncbi:MAG: hypothetical protein KAI75_07225 [Desulfobulbaceae bacterium]|nr:hypothetical protein [Desulfobulbaceae bacterium]
MSPKAARVAVKRGYKNVYCFIGGIAEWRSFNYPMSTNDDLLNIKVKKISSKKLQKQLESDNLFVLDVRPTGFNCRRCHPNRQGPKFLKNTVNCSMMHLHKRYTALPTDKKIIITDVQMKQSPSAARFLTQKGYKVIGVLKGGVSLWQDLDLPMIEEDEVKGLGNFPPFQ